jgi:hypothetical protein
MTILHAEHACALWDPRRDLIAARSQPPEPYAHPRAITQVSSSLIRGPNISRICQAAGRQTSRSLIAILFAGHSMANMLGFFFAFGCRRLPMRDTL